MRKINSYSNILAGTTVLCFLASILCFLASCKKFSEVPSPSTVLTGASVFSTNADAESAMAGMYTTMANSSLGGGAGGISVIPGLSADEVALYPTTQLLQTQVYQNNIQANNSTPPAFWNDCYNLIYQANAAIGGIPSSVGMTTPIKNQFLGEALFLRAYCYFYLVNLYGSVPLVTTTNYQLNATLARTPKVEVYQQIVVDLKQSLGLLSDAYVDGGGQSSSERVRPNKEAVSSLLARVYLYTSDWADAIKQSSAVISSGLYILNPNLNQVFLTNSQEAIWQLELPANNSFNTQDGGVFLPPILSGNGPDPNTYSFYMSNTLVQSFEKGDQRRIAWVDSVAVNGLTYYYPYKYKLEFSGPPPGEYPMMLRYAEQFLILSEAYAHSNQTPQAITNLNIVRSRAGLPGYAGATDTASILKAIMHERQVELFIENGHRWLDLKRTGLASTVMGPPGNRCSQKGGSWSNNAELYPIEDSELQADHNLTQNSGYQ